MLSEKPLLRKDNLYSRRQIEGLIADGRTIIIVDNKVLKVDAWMKFHPGGDIAIKHMVGRDATDEVNAYELHLMFPRVTADELAGFILLRHANG
jgi:hypothetical protein